VITFSVCPQRFAALRAVAPTNDVRSYLNGFAVDLETGHMVAADGPRAIAFPIDAYRVADTVLTFSLPKGAKIPARATAVQFDIDDDITDSSAGTATAVDANGETMCSFPLTRVDVTFPDWKRVMPEVDFEAGNPDNASRQFVAFNPLYLADVAKALKSDAIDMAPTNDGGAIACRFGHVKGGMWSTYADLRFVVMPIRR